MSNLGYSHIAIHPGDVLKEELQSRHISQKHYAQILQVSYTMLNEILNGKRPVTPDLALLIEASLGVDAELWVNMQTRYNLQLARRDSKVLARLESIRRVCAVL